MVPKRHKKCPVKHGNSSPVSRIVEKRHCEGFEYSWANPHRITLPESSIHKRAWPCTMFCCILRLSMSHFSCRLNAFVSCHGKHLMPPMWGLRGSDHLLPVHSIKINISLFLHALGNGILWEKENGTRTTDTPTCKFFLSLATKKKIILLKWSILS